MRVVYYLFLKPLSLLPLPVLFFITWPFYFILAYLVQYRKKVILKNLRNSFPEKSEKEINEIKLKFYRHFFDQILESVRMLSISEAEATKRFKVTNPEVLDQAFEKNQHVALVIGHYNNWEFTPFMNGQIKHQFTAIYSSLKNEFMNEVIKKARSIHSSIMVRRKKVNEYIRKDHPIPYCLLFAADQSPNWRSKLHWTTFLNQKTAFATGFERYSKMLKMVSVYGRMEKVKRGYYQITFEVITDSPREIDEGYIMEEYARRLEDQIKEKPEFWLWSHKRWKKRTEKNLKSQANA